MELSSVMKTLLSKDSVKSLSDRTGASQKDVKSVLNTALPLLLNGVSDQAKDKDSGLEGALKKHAKSDTRDLSDFLGKVDLGDGAKILSHLLGGKKEDTTQSVAAQSGVSAGKTGQILAAVAPLLLSLLGKQADDEKDDEKEKTGGVAGLVGAVLENVDVGSLLTGLLTDKADEDDKKDKKKTGKKKDDGIGLDDVADLLTGLLKG